ncbi:hypothetical protein MGSAQ_000190 [marine sediment metagenome]|uniref:Uncharacterized protein n=1 Tax=marine sediment metagenome TaxID=412755 RepID=A0A1B6NY28_9ZZZZ
MGGEIRRAAEERRVAEGEDAGVAEQQVEGAGEEGEAQHLHQEDRVEVEGRQCEGDHADQDQHGLQAQQRAFGGGVTSPGVVIRRPSPSGRPDAPAARSP